MGRRHALTGRAARRQLDSEYGGDFKAYLQKLEDDIVELEQRFMRTTAQLTAGQEERYADICARRIALKSRFLELPRLRAEGKFNANDMRAIAEFAGQLRFDYRQLVRELELERVAS